MTRTPVFGPFKLFSDLLIIFHINEAEMSRAIRLDSKIMLRSIRVREQTADKAAHVEGADMRIAHLSG
jgi:hypothetical protein